VFLNKHYPEFSAQDFAKFMKSAYHRMYIENRKKLAEYAKINPPPEAKALRDEEPTQAINKEDASYNSAALNLPQTQSVDLSKLRSGDSAVASKSMMIQKARDFETNPNHRLSNTKRPHAAVTSNRGTPLWLPYVFIFTMMGAGLWLLGPELKPFAQKLFPVSKHKITQPQAEPVRGTTELASQQPISLNIQSNPQGATVEINGRVVGITPFVGSIPEGQKFSVRLLREGFIPFELIDQEARKNAQGEALFRINAALQPEPPRGFIEVILVGPWGTDTFVVINGQRVSDRSQLTRYAVPAGVPIRIEARSPFMKAEATQVIEVSRDQLVSVRLPFQTSRTSGNSR
jgi:serine/threonine-protein kinase